jgi:hypothetical protein
MEFRQHMPVAVAAVNIKPEQHLMGQAALVVAVVVAIMA